MKYSKGEASWSFWSLPYEIVLMCLALIPKSYYPKLSLVSKKFQSLLFSKDLAEERDYLKIKERCVFLSVKLPTCYHPYWFSLYMNKSTGSLLVPVPSYYTPLPPLLSNIIGSESYIFNGRTRAPSSVFKVKNNLMNHKWCLTPSMKVARMNTLIKAVLHEKLYVMGGCEPSESTHWGEVFDVKSQTWEPLPDPGPELRASSLKKIGIYEGKLYVITTDKKQHYFYDPEQGSWEVTEILLRGGRCKIDNVTYCFDDKECVWYDSKLKVWDEVKGLDMLDTHDRKDCIEMAKYDDGKVIMFWDLPDEGILCAVISLERRKDEVWGHVEWVDVLILSDSCIPIRCLVASI